jgi:cellulose synthase/poly-beta-1,6-N-acetylglucosamine synthase-like glycosyltransferase
MLFIFSLSLFGIFLVFLGYPLLLFVLARLRPRSHSIDPDYTPAVTLIVACHNPGPLLQQKIDNSLALDYPAEKLSILIVSDGSTDGTAETVRNLRGPRIRGVALDRHDGKAAALNKAIEQAASEILVFSDVDARLPAATLRTLMRHFADPKIGGVCGQRVLVNSGGAALHDAQATYVGWDSRIKSLESLVSSTTSNDGKLYALRHVAAGPIADGVTDDLYAALGAIRRGWRFIFDPDAHALIPTPAKSPDHEISRRRRVVSRSLRSIYLNRPLLNPISYGPFSIALILNKGLRRGIPVLLVCVLITNIWLAGSSWLFAALLSAQAVVYGLALIGYLGLCANCVVSSAARHAYYIVLGMFGTSLGLLDFIRGRTVTVWEPSK